MEKTILAFLVLIFCSIGGIKAHNPYEISYVVKLDQKELIIHLTPKSAIDLLKVVRKDLAKASVLSLADYESEFMAYFNETLNINLNGKRIPFKLNHFDLTQHDSSFHFTLENIPIGISEFDVTLTSFTEVYKRAKNHLTIKSRGENYHYILDANSTRAKGNLKSTNTPMGRYDITLLSFSIMAIFLTLGLITYQKKA